MWSEGVWGKPTERERNMSGVCSKRNGARGCTHRASAQRVWPLVSAAQGGGMANARQRYEVLQDNTEQRPHPVPRCGLLSRAAAAARSPRHAVSTHAGLDNSGSATNWWCGGDDMPYQLVDCIAALPFQLAVRCLARSPAPLSLCGPVRRAVALCAQGEVWVKAAEHSTAQRRAGREQRRRRGRCKEGCERQWG
jgi:hypothetical protein